ncbi:hypothetical protein MSG28_005831 [Choristoneura fumiferana]|uniref:Uncharacterized protein n=1 Tax=Choristoneura fumiferana TaxID=7141 RepID=A0ACC0L0F5_CHOFU|nr:hypothetical protein MSG28_005831 [Choristoneura fumiferana]
MIRASRESFEGTPVRDVRRLRSGKHLDRSTPADDSYVAAAVEYQVSADVEQNLQNYVQLIKEAAEQLLVGISTAARNHQIYVLINVQEFMDCNTVPEGSEDRTPALKPDLGLFTTDFGVTFGHYICFDLMFQVPAIQVVEKNQITDVLFSTMWFSEMPYLSAVQIQEAYAYAENVNFIGAGANNVRVGSAGSGIYSGKAGALVSTMPGLPTTRLLVSRVPKVPGNVTGMSYPGPIYDNPADHDSLVLITDPSLPDHISRPLVNGFQEFTLVDKDVSCRFRVRLNQREGVQVESHKYRAFVQDGSNTYSRRQVGVAACLVVACKNNDSKTCAYRFGKNETHIEIKELEIEMSTLRNQYNKTLQCDNVVYFPSSFRINKFPLSPVNYTYSESSQNEIETGELPKTNGREKIMYKINAPQDELMSFAIWGRIYVRDVDHNTEVTEEDHYHYRAAVFDGERSFSGLGEGDTRICSVIACTGDTMHTCGKSSVCPLDHSDLIISAAFSAIIITGAFIFPRAISGMILASTTLRPLTVLTFSSGVTTDVVSPSVYNNMTQIKRVLAIYTGGTFGMLKDSRGVLVPQYNIEKVIRKLPQLHDVDYWTKHLEKTDQKEYLVLPDGKDTDLKILYKILEYEELKDSSDFTLDDWIKMARDLKKYYHDYDGFVVLHGTDTTAYGASILSFMMETVGKTVVLTGAQVPIFQPRSDGNNNFLCALLIAATQHIPEVTVFFGAKLFRGTRVKKVSNTRIYAFDSPNYPPILEAKTTLDVDPKMLIHPPGSVQDECRIHDQLSRKVYTLKAWSSKLTATATSRSSAKRSTARLSAPSKTTCSLSTLRTFDMTAEAAWAKLSYVLSKTELTYQQKVELMKTNIRGELYNPNHAAVNGK